VAGGQVTGEGFVRRDLCAIRGHIVIDVDPRKTIAENFSDLKIFSLWARSLSTLAEVRLR
jgi:hypothetical protein